MLKKCKLDLIKPLTNVLITRKKWKILFQKLLEAFSVFVLFSSTLGTECDGGMLPTHVS